MKAHALKMVQARTLSTEERLDTKADLSNASTAFMEQEPCKKVEPFLKGRAFKMWRAIPLGYPMGLVLFVDQHLKYTLRQRLTRTTAERYYGDRDWEFSFEVFFARFKKFKKDLKNARRWWKSGKYFDFGAPDPDDPAPPRPVPRDMTRFLRKNFILTRIKVDYSSESEKRSKEQVYAQVFLMQNRNKIPGLSEAIERAHIMWPDKKEDIYTRLVQLKRRLRRDFTRRPSICHTGRKAECVRKILGEERRDSWQSVRLAAQRYIDQFK